jgi:hypothetical protein
MNKFALLTGLVCVSQFSFGFGLTAEFSGTLSDSFESYDDYVDLGFNGYTELYVFGGAGFMQGDGPGMWVINPSNGANWGLGGNGSAFPRTGDKAMGASNNSNDPVSLTFASPTTRFGAYFQTCDAGTYGDFEFSFYDADNNLIGTDAFTTPTNDYVWHGWEHAGGIKKIVMQGNAAPVFDDMQADAVPEPSTMLALAIGGLALRRRRNS